MLGWRGARSCVEPLGGERAGLVQDRRGDLEPLDAAQLGVLDQGDVGVDDPAALVRQDFDRVQQEPVGGRALPLRIGRREVLADVAFADGRLAPAAVRLDTRVAAGRIEPGRLNWEGSVAMNPALSVQGKLRAQHLPLQAFEPYVTADLNVDILRADGSFTGSLRYVQDKAGPLVAVAGDASLDEVRVRAKDEEAGADQNERGMRISQRG